ncbi:MAG TPA: ATP-binding protein [Streptosporangiaceae bacterium]
MAMVEVTFTPLPAHVRTARLVAVAVARRSGVAETLLDEVRLAVGEACSRAVEAHRQYCPAEPVKIELTESGGRFEVVVTDSAPAGPGVPPAEMAGVKDIANGIPVPGEAGAPVRPAAASAAQGSGPGDTASGSAATGSAASGDDTGEVHVPPVNGQSGLQDGFGLAVIAELADDVKISRTPAGISVAMSWPSSAGER